MLSTAFRSTCELALSWARSIQSKSQHPTCWSSILILSSNLHRFLPSGLFLLRFPHRELVYTCPLSHTCYMPHPSHSRFDHSNHIWLARQIIKLRLFICLHFPVTTSVQPQILPSAPWSETPPAYFIPKYERQMFIPIQNRGQNYNCLYLNLPII